MTSVERGIELLHIPMKDVPLSARQYAQQICHDLGGCIEVILTAYAAYAECVEGLSCDDEAYKASPTAIQWFAEEGKKE